MNISKFQQFNNGRVFSTLHNTSLDESDENNKVFMTESNAKVVDFDRVKRIYMNEHGMSENEAKSVDALFQVSIFDDNDSGIYMVEFKNGKVENRDIERKARDSILIFQSITNSQLENTRKNVHFVLVYNEEKNITNYKELRALELSNLGKTDFARFGLSHLRGFCFKEVFACNQKSFEERIVPMVT